MSMMVPPASIPSRSLVKSFTTFVFSAWIAGRELKQRREGSGTLFFMEGSKQKVYELDHLK